MVENVVVSLQRKYRYRYKTAHFVEQLQWTEICDVVYLKYLGEISGRLVIDARSGTDGSP